MAILKLRTFSEVAATLIAERAYNSIKDVEKDLSKINESVTDSLNLLKQFQKNLETAMGPIIVDVNSPAPKKSPSGPTNLKPQLVKSIKKNFVVLESLYEARASLETLEAKLRASSRALGSENNGSAKALVGLQEVRKKVIKGIQDALTFLSAEATKTMPENFAEFIKKMGILAKRSLTYESANTFSYLFISKEETLVYTAYLQLKDLIDDKGARIPELFIVISLDMGATKNSNKYYLDVLFEFETPSDKLLTSEINPMKMSGVANNLAELLNVSHFANSIQRIPIGLLLNPAKLTRSMFSYSEYIDTLEVTDDGTNQINFWLKPDVVDKPLIDDIAKQLYLDFRGLISSTRAKVRTAFPQKKKGGVTRQVITFFVTRESGSPAAQPEDVEFLKDRFNLSDSTVVRILQTINKE